MPVRTICGEAVPCGIIHAGVSSETLMVVMRHADFTTTQKF